MPRRSDISKLLVMVTGTVVILLASSAFACTEFYKPQVVGPVFSVLVTGRYGPQSNMEVTLQPDAEDRTHKKRVVRTDNRGFAKFNGVPEGTYNLSAIRAQMSDVLLLEVHAADNYATHVELTWPSPKMLVVRTLAGSIYGANTDMKLELEDEAGNNVWSGKTGESGAFSVQAPVFSGFYRLKLAHTGGEADYISLELNQHATAGSLELAVGWSSCGLSFTNLEDCTLATLQPTQCGSVHDVSGGAIANAKVIAYDGNHRFAATTNSEGEFTIDGLAPGKYEVSITASAFTPLRATVIIDRITEASCDRPADVALGLLGSCSSVRQRGPNE